MSIVSILGTACFPYRGTELPGMAIKSRTAALVYQQVITFASRYFNRVRDQVLRFMLMHVFVMQQCVVPGHSTDSQVGSMTPVMIAVPLASAA